MNFLSYSLKKKRKKKCYKQRNNLRFEIKKINY